MTPDEREKNRLKLTRWRARNADKLAARAEQAAAYKDIRKVGRRPTWTVAEYVYQGGPWDGLPALVAAHKVDEPPAFPRGVALVLSHRWTLTGAVSRATARRLAAARLRQIVAWCGLSGSQRPEWWCRI